MTKKNKNKSNESKKKNNNHYINNEDFLQRMVEWKKCVKEAKESGDPIPPVTTYIAQCFLEIAQNLAKKPNFVNYQFKEDMIGDAIENCLLYCDNFDPNKSENPFSYFTQITYFAFLRRIQKEKKQSYIKYKYLKSMDEDGDLREYLKQIGISEDEAEIYDNITLDSKKKKKKKKKKIDIFSDDLK
jgi:hypothetical protein